MLERLKKLDYVSVKENDNLEKISILYVEDNNDVYTKTVCAGTLEIDDLENIPEFVEKFFIDIVKHTLRHEEIINIESKDIDENINKYFEELKPLNDKFHNTDKFIMTDKNIENRVNMVKNGVDIKNSGIPIIISKYLDNEIIVGYKTQVDQPGIIAITNENALIDKNKIQIAITDIGFFPEKAYYILKIK